MAEWKASDMQKKEDKRQRAIQLAQELRKKKNAENFELSASGTGLRQRTLANPPVQPQSFRKI